MRNRILIAGTSSGCGKTTVTCAVLAALKARGADVAAFKCGPDYIDPMFHREALGVPSQNLDPFFCTEEQLHAQLAASDHKLAVVEGVMGYYDGAGADGRYSTYDVARITKTPVILVVDAKGMYTSAGAVIRGFRDFRPDSGICGVIFNGATPALYPGLKAIAEEAGAVALGFLPREETLSIGSRHLGLITAGEIADIREKLRVLGRLAEQHLDLDGILALAATAPSLAGAREKVCPIANVRIAVARDDAFCFLYQENLALLSALGAELCFFSPTHDRMLPAHAQGLYLPGGYPELHAKALSQNTCMRETIRQAMADGLATIAECGGFLYLHDTLDALPMAGVIHAAAYRTKKLQRFGYVTLCAQSDNLLCRAGDCMHAHEFHYYESTSTGQDFLAKKASGAAQYSCIHATPTLYAGFPHLYFPANPSFAESFIRKAASYVPAR